MQTENKTGWAKSGASRAAATLLSIASFWFADGAAGQTVASMVPQQPVSWAKRTFGRMNWAEVDRAYAAPREICRLVEKNVRYKTEKKDHWAHAGETWDRSFGDCEDFAILIQRLCRNGGMDAKVHLYIPSKGGEGHAVLVGEWNGKIWFSSNGSYEEVKSEQDVARRVAGMLSCKQKDLWVMRLGEREVANYIEKASTRAVATASR